MDNLTRRLRGFSLQGDRRTPVRCWSGIRASGGSMLTPRIVPSASQYCLEAQPAGLFPPAGYLSFNPLAYPECHQYLTNQFTHLIYDNIEEDYPVAHDLLADGCRSWTQPWSS